MIIRRVLPLIGALLATVALTTGASATLLPPNSTGPPDVAEFFGPGNLLLADTGLQALTADTGTFTGFGREAVYRNLAGGLNFYYQFSNNLGSIDDIARMTATNFTGFITDVGTLDPLVFAATTGVLSGVDPFSYAGTVLPLSVDRSGGPGGDRTIGFTFLPGVKPGQTSQVLYISTNATTFSGQKLALHFIDGGNAAMDGYSPVPGGPSIPEPAFYQMAGLCGFGGLGLLRLRRPKTTVVG